MSDVSVLLKDLTQLPSIVGNLGLSIAAAQKAFDLEYLESMERIIVMIKQLLGEAEAAEAATAPIVELKNSQISALLAKLAPSRYQYTETQLEFHADLAQSKRSSASAGLGINLGAIAVNASYASAFGYDYRASALIRTTISAIPSDATVFAELLSRARELSDKAKILPDTTPDVDKQIADASQRIYKQITGSDPK